MKPLKANPPGLNPFSRRRFLRCSTLSGFSLAAFGSGLSALPFARVLGANEAVRLGVIGIGSSVKIGGKGKQDIRDFRKIPGVRIVALCDTDRAHLDPQVEKFKNWNEPVEAYTDVRRLLENRAIDGVTITTPNHWHALAAVWACQAGKDVFVQKPASHNVFEGRKMVEAARKYNRVMQCTSGSRSRSGIKEALAFARASGLGTIRYVHGVNFKPRTNIGRVPQATPVPRTLDFDLWSGPAPVQPVMRECLHYDWHWDWQFGNGDLGNMGIHYLDGCRMATGQDRLPKHVISIGGRFGYADDGQTPNSLLTFFDYEPVPVIFEVRGLPKEKSLQNSPWDKNAKATMDTFCGLQIGVTVQCEHGYVANNKAFDREGKLIREFQPTNAETYTNFVDVMRSRKFETLEADILQGHLSAALMHAANISYRLGKRATPGEIKERISQQQDALSAYQRLQDHLEANGVGLNQTPAVLGPMLTFAPDIERFTGEFSAEANRLLTREYRPPFVVPDKV